MAEEAKKIDVKKLFWTLFKVILGLAFLILGIWAIVAWKEDLLMVIRGCLGLFLFLAGVVTLAVAKE